MASNRFVVTTLVVLLAVIAALQAYPSFVQDPFAPARTKLYGAPAATRSLQDTMASCSLSNAKMAVEALADLMDTFNIDVVAAARNDTIKFKALVDIVGTVSYVANKLGGCEDFVKTLVRNAREVEITVPKTRMCVEESDSEEYKQDPCCSQEAADEQCCAPRSIKIKANAISDFANSTIYNTCRHPEMVKAAISNYYRKYKSNMHQCAFNAAKSQIVFGETIERVTRCYATVFTSPMSCSSDDDCYKGTTCDTSSNTCSTQDLQDGTPLVDCIKKSVNADIFENIKYILGVSGKSEAEVIAAFTEFVSSEMCVNGYIPLLPKYELKSESECLAETKCNDNKATCENNNKFCGAIKAANGIYTVDVSGILTTESECNRYGLCVGAKSSDAYKLSKTECEAESFCTNEDCGDNCTKEKCEALGRCLGAGITSFCILPFSYTASGRVCLSGERGPSGCINTNINTEVACNLLKGRFISARDTKEKCEALQVCQNEGSITFREKAVCEECGGTSASVFKWAPARYIQRRFVPVSTWATRETKSVNIWKRALDYGKIFPAMTKLVLGLQYPIFKTVVSCTMSPALTIFRNIACDCDPSTPEGTECFSEESLKAAAASFRFLASLATDQQYSTPEVSVIVKAGSKATVSIDVTKTEVLVQVDINNRRAISATDGIPVLKGSATVGQMVGNGFSLTGDKAFSATLCIQRDVTIQTTSTEYVNPAFAIKDSDGNYIVTSIPIDEERSDDGSVQICGVVRDTRTYYPALVNDEAKPPASSASKTGSSLFLVLIAFCVLMML